MEEKEGIVNQQGRLRQLARSRTVEKQQPSTCRTRTIPFTPSLRFCSSTQNFIRTYLNGFRSGTASLSEYSTSRPESSAEAMTRHLYTNRALSFELDSSCRPLGVLQPS